MLSRRSFAKLLGGLSIFGASRAMAAREAVKPRVIPKPEPIPHPDPRMRPVRLTQTGGSGGTDTTPATWTYTAHDAGTGTLVRENVRYAGYRPVGMMLPATYGLYRDGQIHWCDEALPGAYGEFTTITETELTRRTVITGVDCNPDGTITVHPTEFGGHWVYPPRA